MFCKKCGQELKEDTRFCPKCGCSISELKVQKNEKSCKKGLVNLKKITALFIVLVFVVVGIGIIVKFAGNKNEKINETVQELKQETEDIQDSEVIIEEEKTDEPEKEVEAPSKEEINRYLSTLIANNVKEYSTDNINGENLLWFAMDIFLTDRWQEIEIGNEYILSVEQVNEVLEYYFDTSINPDNYGDIRYENEKFYYPIRDGASLCLQVAVAEDMTPIENDKYEISFYTYDIWGENFETGEENPKQNWDEYYTYTVEQMENDKFCEKTGQGIAQVEILSDRIVTTQIKMNNEISDGDFVTLVGTLKRREDGNLIVELDMPFLFHGANSSSQIEAVGMTGVDNVIPLKELLGTKVQISGKAMEAHTQYHYEQVMILEGYSSLIPYTSEEAELEENNEIRLVKRINAYKYYSGEEKLAYYIIPEYEETREIGREEYYDDNVVRYRYEYDENGNKIKEIRIEDDGEEWTEYEYDYDEQNKRIRSREYESDGDMPWWTEYIYNEKGECTQETRYNASMRAKSISWKHEYDAQGYRIKTTVFNEFHGENMSWTEYGYDAFGNCISETKYDISGIMEEKIEREY